VIARHAGVLIAVDGVNGTAVLGRASRVLATARRRGGVSRWDASGLFEQLMVDDVSARPSARTLLLLYAADLAFRLRWEIEPKLAEGKTVVAAPYIDTAIAFGRAAGLRDGWLKSLFMFASPPWERRLVNNPMGRRFDTTQGFVEFACAHLKRHQLGFSGRDLASRTRAQLALKAGVGSRGAGPRPAPIVQSRASHGRGGDLL
jgi:hypothetical protein